MSDEDIDEESNQRENTRTQIAQAVSNKLNSKKPDGKKNVFLKLIL